MEFYTHEYDVTQPYYVGDHLYFDGSRLTSDRHEKETNIVCSKAPSSEDPLLGFMVAHGGFPAIFESGVPSPLLTATYELKRQKTVK